MIDNISPLSEEVEKIVSNLMFFFLWSDFDNGNFDEGKKCIHDRWRVPAFIFKGLDRNAPLSTHKTIFSLAQLIFNFQGYMQYLHTV